MKAKKLLMVVSICAICTVSAAQTNPLWQQGKVKNYLPHMTWPEVQALLTRSDMVIIPSGSLEQHGLHLPIGTDFFHGVERAKLIAQRTDVLVAPILMPGNSGYHMGFAGSMTLSAEIIQKVYFESAQSLMSHGFRRFLFLNSHGGNRIISQYVVDRINHETEAVAVELNEAIGPYRKQHRPYSGKVFDRHAGVFETSLGLYLFPSLVDMASARTAALEMPERLEKMIPLMSEGDETAVLIFRSEGLKPVETGKGSSAREVSDTGVWGRRDPTEASAEEGRQDTEDFVDAAVQFIERWKTLRPMKESNNH